MKTLHSHRCHHLALAAALACLPACNSIPAHREPITPGTVLLLPPRDSVQNGSQHEKAGATGSVLLEAVETRLRGSGFEPKRTEATAFDHMQIASEQTAIAEAKRLGTDYCLQLVLGEFRNAAPFSFRTDFVTLEKGTMWHAASGRQVWWLERPYMLDKGNIGGIDGLLRAIGVEVADSVAGR